jgi:hypothetical protein
MRFARGRPADAEVLGESATDFRFELRIALTQLGKTAFTFFGTETPHLRHDMANSTLHDRRVYLL